MVVRSRDGDMVAAPRKVRFNYPYEPIPHRHFVGIRNKERAFEMKY